MNKKICPLLSMADEDDSLIPCEGGRCAWYIPDQKPGNAGRCAVQALGNALPDREANEKAAQGAANTQDGEMEQESSELNYSDASLTEEREERQE